MISLEQVKHVGVSLNGGPNNLRISGKTYLIVSDLRSTRLKYIGEDGQIYSAEKKHFKILPKKYIKTTYNNYVNTLV